MFNKVVIMFNRGYNGYSNQMADGGSLMAVKPSLWCLMMVSTGYCG